MPRPTLIALATLSVLPALNAQATSAGASSTTPVVSGSASSKPVTVREGAAGTTENTAAKIGDVLTDAGNITKDAVSVETVEFREGGVVTKTKETLPEAAVTKLSGLLRTRQTLPGGAQVTQQHGPTTAKDAALSLVQPPFSHTRQQGRGTVTEKSYLPIALPTELFSSTEQHSGGVTTNTGATDRLQNLRNFYYTKKRHAGGVESYGPPEFLPDANTFAPLTRVTERLPNGTTVTRDRTLVSTLKNPSRIGFTTSSTVNGVTTQKFHSLVPDAPLSVDWAKARGALGGEKVEGQADKHIDGSMVAVTPSYKNAYQKAEGTLLNNSAAQTAKNTAGSVWSQLNPLNWGRAIANTTKGALSQGAAVVPKAQTGGWNPKSSLIKNKDNVMRPGG